MKVSLNWLKDFVALPATVTPDMLSRELTMSTVEVEGYEVLGENLERICVGKITEISPHPKADRLRLAVVDIGDGAPQQVVCGASNLSVGMLIAFAALGAKVKWHGEGELIELKEAEIRGVKSAGMICGANEIGLEGLFPAKSEKEIVDLTSFNFNPGTPISEALNLNDVIFEIDNKSLTNRPDLWGHLGIARELSAIFKAPLKEPTLPPLSSYIQKSGGLEVSIKETTLCKRYIGVAVENVKVCPSPLWMQVRLASVGQRSINLIVDLTNYVMFALGQPLHAFDARKVQNGSIVVRKAQAGEELALLDGTSLKLSDSNLVIADKEKSLALAGVMGGKDSGIEADVTSLVLESANFQAVPIRKTATQYKLRTESSMRFEKGIDTERTEKGMLMLVSMLLEHMPEARVLGGVDVYPTKPEPVTVTVDADFIISRIGKKLLLDEMKQLLERLGYTVSLKGNQFTVLVPAWRATGDVSIPEDIVEEIARLYGYDNIEFVPLKVELKKAVPRNRYNLEKSIREYLAYQASMSEIFSYPWSESDLLVACGVELDSCLELSEPPSPTQRFLHPTLVPELLGAARGNLRFFDSFSLFEMARVFQKDKVSVFSREKEKLPHQPKQVSGVIAGKDAKEVFFKAKGILEGLFSSVMMKRPELKQSGAFSSWVVPGAGLGVFLDGVQIGELGLVTESCKRQADISKGELAVFEVNVDALIPLSTIEYTYTPLPKYPQTDCDFSFIFDETTSWNEIYSSITDAHPFIKNVTFIEEYRGEQIPSGKKSLSLNVTLGNPEGSLTSNQIKDVSDLIIKNLTETCKGTIR